MRPEWLVDVPPDLARAWCVLPRPEGRRALVVASRGSTAARAKTGGVSRRFASALPGGSRATQRGGGEGGFCILDCVFHEPDATYYVLDTLAWNGVSLYDCAAEMRAAWTHAKLGHPETAECPEAGAANANTNAFRFAPLPVYDADAAGIRNAYDAAPVPFQRDGLLFLAKDGAYELGVTPLAALWKDARCSRYFLEENPGSSDPERQRVVLSLDAATGDVVTGDVPRRSRSRGSREEYVAPEDGGAAPPGGGLRHGAAASSSRSATAGSWRSPRSGAVLARVDLVYEGLANQRRGLRRGRGDQDPVPVLRATRPDHGRRARATPPRGRRETRRHPGRGTAAGAPERRARSARRGLPASPGALMRRSTLSVDRSGFTAKVRSCRSQSETNVGGVRVEDIAMDE